ncbi:MAG: 1-phosphofructokinase [Erysipelotrichaceae bacterium]|nr:1-phosphofructokinase [Erysipelotrichaceae bacterium]
MIYTVTFNPSLDYIIRVRDFREGQINRTEYERIFAGGKGINVSLVLDNLGHESTALGFTAGFTGAEIERRLQEEGISCRFIRVKEGHSRINVKMKSGMETEINGQGPKITPENIEELFVILEELTKEDILVISGSVPKTLPGDMYERIMERLKGKGVRIVVDAEKDLLTRVLPYRPFLIKPNNHELSEIFGVSLKTREDVVPYARKMKEKGAVNVLVSMAGEGAVLLDEDGKQHMSEAPKGTLVNSVGAGDSMVAGFLAGYLETGDYETAFRMGLCTGSASAFSEELATREEVEALMEQTFDKGE